MAARSASFVRVAALCRSALNLAKSCSIGFRSGLSGGRLRRPPQWPRDKGIGSRSEAGADAPLLFSTQNFDKLHLTTVCQRHTRLIAGGPFCQRV